MACDRYQRGYRQCMEDRGHDATVIAGLQAANRGHASEEERLVKRVAELEAERESRWSPLKIGSVGACVGGIAHSGAQQLTQADLLTKIVGGTLTVVVCVVAVVVD